MDCLVHTYTSNYTSEANDVIVKSSKSTDDHTVEDITYDLSNGGVVLPVACTTSTISSISNVAVGSSDFKNKNEVSTRTNSSSSFKVVPKRIIERNDENTPNKKFRVDPGVTMYSNGNIGGVPPPDKPLSWDEYMKYIDTYR